MITIASSRYVAYNAAKQLRSSMDDGFSDLPMAAMRTIDPRRIEVLDEAVVEVLRAKTVAERVAMAFDAERTMRLMLEAHLHSRHPEWDDRQVASEIARRRLLGTTGL